MRPYLGELLALTTAVCWSLTAVFFSYSGRQIGSDAVNRTRLLLALAFISLTHWLLQGTPFPLHVETFRWGWLALSSILGLVIGDAALFEAYVLVGPRLGTLMMATVPVISALLAWLFLGERVSGQEFIGILVTIGGIAWVVTEKRENNEQVAGGKSKIQNPKSKIDYRRGLLFGLLGALGQSTNLIAAKFALVDHFPTISALHIRILVAAVIVWVVAAGQGKVGRIVRQWR
ncbi:MAG: DMT family transporter, partial [Chloroflexota bacterium]